MTDTGKCGTLTGRDIHRRRGEPVCDDCKAAAAQAQRERRADPKNAALDARRNAARQRAMTKLAQRHPTEYAELYAEEMRKDQP